MIFEKGKFFNQLSNSIFFSTLYIFMMGSLLSLEVSIRYLIDKDSIFENQYIYYPLLLNKYIIFMLTFFSQKQDEESELLSNSSLVSIYLFILEIIISLLKRFVPLFYLIIIQIVFSSIIGIPSFIILINLIIIMINQLIITYKKICC